MKKLLFLLFSVACMLMSIGASAQAEKVYNEEVNAMEQINEALEQARESDRYVMCQVGGNWCPWCLRFAEFARTDSVIAPLMEENYVYIHVNYSKENKNLAAGLMKIEQTEFPWTLNYDEVDYVIEGRLTIRINGM